MDRKDRLKEHIDVANGRGLEVGPLASPIVAKSEGAVSYVDHASTEDLLEKYAKDPGVDSSKIVPIDFVWGKKTLAQAVGSKAPFDYVVASHVIEHVPDLIGWLREVTEVLRPGGRLSICAPDRQYTFDVRRRDSDLSEIVEAWLLGLRRPSVRATFDHFYRFVEVDTMALWRGETGHQSPPFNFADAMSLARRAAETTDYLDTHCWVFTAESFVQLMQALMAWGLIDLRFVAFTSTPQNTFEFFATFEKPIDSLDADARRQKNAQSAPVFDTRTALPDQVEPSPNGEVAAPPATVRSEPTLELSDIERRVVVTKRAVFNGLRRLVGRR